MPLPRALGGNQLRQPGPLGQRHHRYQARTRQGEPNEHHPQEQLGNRCAHARAASSIGVWILQVVLAAIIASGGISKLAGDPVMVDMFADIGWPVAPVPGRSAGGRGRGWTSDPGSGGPGQSRVGGIADRCCHHRSVRARAEPLAAARLTRRGGRDRKDAVVAHRRRRRHAAQALRQTSRTEM